MHNRNAHSYFELKTTGGGLINLNSSYDGPRLSNGEDATVRYLGEYGAVLDLEVLSGSNAHWTLHEKDGLGLARTTCYAGIALGLPAMLLGLKRAKD